MEHCLARGRLCGGRTGRSHVVGMIRDGYRGFGARQFIWRAGDPKVKAIAMGSRPGSEPSARLQA